jgi:hypothetical protein
MPIVTRAPAECDPSTDLILWDSRQIHYNKVPSTQNVRAVMYICYTPASFASKEDIEKKASYFKDRYGTVSQFWTRFGHEQN